MSGECLEVGENYLDIPNQLVRGNGTTQECWYEKGVVMFFLQLNFQFVPKRKEEEKGVVIGGLSVHKDKALTRMSGI